MCFATAGRWCRPVLPPKGKRLRTGRGVLARGLGTGDYFGSHAAEPQLTEMVGAKEPGLATVCGQESGPPNSGAGAAGAKRNRADDVTAYGEEEMRRPIDPAAGKSRGEG